MTKEQLAEAEKYLSENKSLVDEYLQFVSKKENTTVSKEEFDVEYLYINVMLYKVCRFMRLLDDDEQIKTIRRKLG